MWVLVLGVVLACHVDPIKTVSSVKCEIKEYSHGWKLTGIVGYVDKASVHELITPGEGRVFFENDAKAFEKCVEWRKCILSEEKAKANAKKKGQERKSD